MDSTQSYTVPSSVAVTRTTAPDRRCLVAVCHNGPVVFSRTAKSLMEIGWGNRVERAKAAHGFSAIDFTWEGSFPRVDALRNRAVELARHDGIVFGKVPKQRHTHILFLDADMTWPSDVLLRMLKHHDKPVVAGLYHLKGGDHAPVAMRDGIVPEGSTVTQYFHDRGYRDTGTALRQEQVVGMGCTLIQTSVFDVIGPRPWFEYADSDGWPLVSEDVPFCQKVAAAGLDIWLDPTVKCGHVEPFTITERWHKAHDDDQSSVRAAVTDGATDPPAIFVPAS
jgi:hypothetical protein